MASPLTFDPSVVEIFTTLSCGATLLILDELMRLRSQQLAMLLTDVHHVTVLQVMMMMIMMMTIMMLRARVLVSTEFHGK